MTSLLLLTGNLGAATEALRLLIVFWEAKEATTGADVQAVTAAISEAWGPLGSGASGMRLRRGGGVASGAGAGALKGALPVLRDQPSVWDLA